MHFCENSCRPARRRIDDDSSFAERQDCFILVAVRPVCIIGGKDDGFRVLGNDVHDEIQAAHVGIEHALGYLFPGLSEFPRVSENRGYACSVAESKSNDTVESRRRCESLDRLEKSAPADSSYQINRGLERYAEAFGADRLLFGTDLPSKSAGAARARNSASNDRRIASARGFS